ncbi:hypothetical protein ACIQXF_13375 [Lysinibacillus sp. NPDC097231]
MASTRGIGQRDVGHSVVTTGRGVFRLSSSISVGVWTLTEKVINIAFSC